MAAISVSNSEILIRDSIDASRERIKEAEEEGLMTREGDWCISSFDVEAIYTGPEVIQDRTLATRHHKIPVWLNCMPRPVIKRLALMNVILCIVPGLVLTVNGALSNDAELAIGITLLTVGIVCGISACFFDCIAKSKEEQFRQNVKKELTPELLETAKQTAEARIRAAREARTIHYVAQE